jgi:hypothetical protein
MLEWFSAVGTFGALVVLIYIEVRRWIESKPQLNVWIDGGGNNLANLTFFNSGGGPMIVRVLDVASERLTYGVAVKGGSFPGGQKTVVKDFVIEPKVIYPVIVHCQEATISQFELRFQMFDGRFHFLPMDAYTLGPYKLSVERNWFSWLKQK